MRRFAYRLARHLGEPNPDRLLNNISAERLMEWKAASMVDPPAGRRLEWMLAQLTALVANLMSEEEHRPKEFIPDFDMTERDRKEQRADLVRKKMQMEKIRRTLMDEGG